MAGKYEPLALRLASLPAEEGRVELSFEEIERLVGPLPRAAERADWWRSVRGAQARAWLGVGWQLADVDVQRGRVTFERRYSPTPALRALVIALVAVGAGVAVNATLSAPGWATFTAILALAVVLTWASAMLQVRGGSVWTVIGIAASLAGILLLFIVSSQSKTTATRRSDGGPVTSATLMATLTDPADQSGSGDTHRAAVVFNPGGDTVAAALAGRLVKLWPTRDLKPGVTPVTVYATEVMGIAFNPRQDRAMLVTAGYHMDPQRIADYDYDTIRLWTVADRPRPGIITTFDHDEVDHNNVGEDPTLTKAVAFSADGRILATAGGGIVKFWDVSNPGDDPPKVVASLPRQESGVVAVAFSPDRRVLATAALDKVTLWDVADLPRAPRELYSIRHTDPVVAIAFSPKGAILATADLDRIFTLWNIADPTDPHEISSRWRESEDAADVDELAFSTDGATLAAARHDNTVQLWNLAKRWSPILTTTLATNGPAPVADGKTAYASTVAFSPDGQILATCNEDNTVKLWRLTH
jgi:WD40 repeat protein